MLVAQRWILACLRNRTFFSLDELNTAIAELLEKLNARPFKKLEGCRRSAFETLDRPALRPLPHGALGAGALEEGEGEHRLPRRVRRPPLQRAARARRRARRVARHQRRRRDLPPRTARRQPRAAVGTEGLGQHRSPEHRPRSHREYGAWPPSRIVDWAASIGPSAAALVEQILLGRREPESAYRSCMAPDPQRQGYDQRALRRRLPARDRDRRADPQERAGDPETAASTPSRPVDATETELPLPRPPRERARRRLLRPKGDRPIMTDEETIQKLLDLKLTTMAQAFRDLLAEPPGNQRSFTEKIGRHGRSRVDRSRQPSTRRACCAPPTSPSTTPRSRTSGANRGRGLDKAVMRDLATCQWIRKKHNVIVVGKTGVGKSYLGAALAQAACRKGLRAMCTRVPRLAHELAIARADGTYTAMLARLAKTRRPRPRRLSDRAAQGHRAPRPARGLGRSLRHLVYRRDLSGPDENLARDAGRPYHRRRHLRPPRPQRPRHRPQRPFGREKKGLQIESTQPTA